MSSKKNNQLINEKKGYAVCGYIRENFEEKCFIEEIMATIFQFYVIKGGSLYVCGYGGKGRLGIQKYKNDYCKTLTLCPPFTNNNAYKVSAGSMHTLILDTDGDVWCCGLGEHGQLGNGKKDDVYVPTKLILGMRVVAVSAGGYHSLLLCENGTVKGCGSNKHGQICFGKLKRTLVSKTIEKLEKYRVIQISAGSYHSAILTEDGGLFCFGDNCFGQCGVGKEKRRKIKTPTKVDLDDEIEFVECGDNHTLVITRGGLFYSFGEGKYGQLGHGDVSNKYVPKLIESLKEKKIKLCAAGYMHSLCIDKEGIIWSSGDNYRGQCGLSKDIKEQTTPKMITWFIRNNIKANGCFAGGFSSSVIATDGCLYLFGRNNEYQLGLQRNKSYYTPAKLSIPQNVTVQSVSLQESHTAMIWSVSTLSKAE